MEKETRRRKELSRERHVERSRGGTWMRPIAVEVIANAFIVQAQREEKGDKKRV